MKRPPSARKSPPKKRGAKKATHISVKSEKQISALVARFQLQGTLLTFRDVRAALNTKYGTALSLGTVWYMGRGHMPRDRATRKALGLNKRKPRMAWKPIARLLWAAWLGRNRLTDRSTL